MKRTSTKKTVTKTKAVFADGWGVGFDSGFDAGWDEAFEHVRKEFAKKHGLAKEFDAAFRVKV